MVGILTSRAVLRPAPVLRAIALLWLSLAAACSSDPLDPNGEAATSILYDGCSSIAQGPTCFLPPSGKLTIWIGANLTSPIDVTLNTDPLPFTSHPALDGTQLRIVAPQRNGELLVKAKGLSSPWRLAVRAHQPRPEVVNQARKLRRQNQLDQARKLLVDELGKSSENGDAIVLGQLARVERARGDYEAAIGFFEQAIALHKRLGNLSLEVADVATMSYVLIEHLDRFHQARRALETIRGYLPQHAKSRYHYHYYLGYLSAQTGDHRTALMALDRAAHAAEKVGRNDLRQNADQIKAWTLQALGEHKEAIALTRQALDELPTNAHACRQAQHLTNYAWALLLLRESGKSTTVEHETALAAFQRVLKLLRTDCSGYASQELNTLINLAIAASHEGAFDESQRYLAEARERFPKMEAIYELWSLDIDARIAESRGLQKHAVERYDRMGRLAENRGSLAFQWRALVGRAEALAYNGNLEAAHDSWAAALDLAREESLDVPIHNGRDTFLAQRESATRRYVESLLRAGQERRAFEVIHQARAQALRGLNWSERIANLDDTKRIEWDVAMTEFGQKRKALENATTQAWQVPADQGAIARSQRESLKRDTRHALDRALAVLGSSEDTIGHRDNIRELDDGDLELTFYQLRHQWMGFARTSTELTVQDLGKLTPLELPVTMLSRRLLKPFARQIHQAKLIRLVSHGELSTIDLHALPFEGSPLGIERPVVYSLGTGLPEEPAPAPSGSVLIVADPRGDLPAARAEGSHIHHALQARVAAEKLSLITGDGATATAIRKRMSGSQIFHYAGHGLFNTDDRWGNALLLADDSKLRIGDVFSLKKSPIHVVLTACETARTQNHGAGETMALASAFAAAGSRTVIAATRPVTDKLGATVSSSLYRNLEQLDMTPQRFRAAIATAHEKFPDSDWSSFRMFVP